MRRGLGNAMGIEDQSVAVQWLQLAQQVRALPCCQSRADRLSRAKPEA